MNEKPKMYQNRITKEIHNNKEMYTSIGGQNNYNKLSITTIKKKINEIINSNTFIYSKLVHIIINGETIKRKLVGLYNNN